jgi:hypothetical protein
MYHSPLLELSRIFGMYHGIHESKRMHIFSHIFSPKEGRALRMCIESSSWHDSSTSLNEVKLAWNGLKFKFFGLYNINPAIIPETTLHVTNQPTSALRRFIWKR